MGLKPLTASNIKDYCEGAGIELCPEEFSVLYDISREFCGKHADFKDGADTTPPYEEPQ